MLKKVKIDQKDIEQYFANFYKKIETEYDNLLSNNDGFFIENNSSIWEKYDKKRVYYSISIVKHYPHKLPAYKTRKHFKCGYYDILNNNYIVDNESETDLLSENLNSNNLGGVLK